MAWYLSIHGFLTRDTAFDERATVEICGVAMNVVGEDFLIATLVVFAMPRKIGWCHFHPQLSHVSL